MFIWEWERLDSSGDCGRGIEQDIIGMLVEVDRVFGVWWNIRVFYRLGETEIFVGWDGDVDEWRCGSGLEGRLVLDNDGWLW